MKKFVFLLLFITVLLVGCGTQNQVKEVTDLISTANYEESINKINEYQLSDEFNTQEVENLKKMESLLSEGAYTRVLSHYRKNPITDEKLQSKSDELLLESLEGSTKNPEVFKLASMILEDLDSETKIRVEEAFDIEKVKQEVDSITKMEELLSEGAYTRTLSQYRNQPVTVENLQPTSDDIIIKSLEGSTENPEVFKLAYLIFEDFDSETKARIKEDFDIEKVKQELGIEAAK